MLYLHLLQLTLDQQTQLGVQDLEQTLHFLLPWAVEMVVVLMTVDLAVENLTQQELAETEFKQLHLQSLPTVEHTVLEIMVDQQEHTLIRDTHQGVEAEPAE